MIRYLAVVCCLLGFHSLYGQIRVTGQLTDSAGKPVTGVHILLLPDSLVSSTDARGFFVVQVARPGTYTLQITHVQYKTLIKRLNIRAQENKPLHYILSESATLLPVMEVKADKAMLEAVSPVRIEAAQLQLTPVLFGEVTNILATLPSVAANNELSSAYSVRGGSYDENLVLVNNIPVYRPFLVRSGQQEGLSFINTDLVAHVDFSAGGWPVRYDDKMASVLSANYRQPQQLAGSAMASLLGAKAHIEGRAGERLTFLAGVRHRRSAYLFNTLNTEADYIPLFTDVQTFFTYQLSPSSTLAALFAYAQNTYRVIPHFAQTSFGTFNRELRLEVAFDGSERMDYRTYQGALQYMWQPNERFTWLTTVSLANYFEGENIDVEGGYRLCDIDKNLGSDTFNQCVAVRGVGSLYNYARNRLSALLADVNTEFAYELPLGQLQGGLAYAWQAFDDNLNEYSFTDSAGYVRIESSILATNSLQAHLFKGYLQHVVERGAWQWRYGIRGNYNTLNGGWLLSPRVLAQWRSPDQSRLRWSFGAGLYGQQPFYKEYRQPTGETKTGLQPQNSLQLNAGMGYELIWWGRLFLLQTEAYYKYLWNQIPYIINNVRQIYYPDYTATGYVAGFEARLGGEFVKGTESWFSLGIMSAKERIVGIDSEYVRRPTDQRFKLAIVFEDHLPADSTWRVRLNFQYGSGLPVGPPGNLALRNSFQGDDYIRLDIGFYKDVFFREERFLKYLRLGAEINNLLGTRNAVAYTWITDVNNNQFAIPNYLTGRLFNVVLSAAF